MNLFKKPEVIVRIVMLADCVGVYFNNRLIFQGDNLYPEDLLEAFRVPYVIENYNYSAKENNAKLPSYYDELGYISNV